jgi:hypothetical protein
VPKSCLHKPSGQAYVTLAGRVHYLGKHGSDESHERYRRLVRAALEVTAAQDKGDRPARLAAAAGPAMTVTELVARFFTEHALGYYVKDGETTSEIRDLKLSLRPLRELYGTTPAATFVQGAGARPPRGRGRRRPIPRARDCRLGRHAA